MSLHGAIYTISTGITLGRQKSLIAAIGCTIGIIPHILIGIFGVTLLSTVNPFFFTFIQFLGACYLIRLGIKMFTSNLDLTINNKKGPTPNYSIIIHPILINLLNPKLTFFFLSFLPQFVNTDKHNTISQTLTLGLIFMILTLLIFIIYGQLSSTFTRLIQEHPNHLSFIQKSIGSTFIVFALQLIISLGFQEINI